MVSDFKELVSSSERVLKMAANAQAFGGSRPGGDLTTARGLVQYVRSGGILKAGRLGEETVEEGKKEWKKAFGSVAKKNLQKDIGSIRSNIFL